MTEETFLGGIKCRERTRDGKVLPSDLTSVLPVRFLPADYCRPLNTHSGRIQVAHSEEIELFYDR